MAKILHIGKYFPPESGGIESVTQSLASGATRAGHLVSIVCFTKLAQYREEDASGAQVVRVPSRMTLFSQPLSIRYLIICTILARRVDIIHLHLPNILGLMCVLMLPTKKKLLVHWHSDILNKGLLGKLIYPLELIALRRADQIIATSQIYADASVILSRFAKKIAIVPLGSPDLSERGPLGGISSAITEFIGNRRVILVVGRLVPYKGHRLLIQAAELVRPDAAIIIVGDGPLAEELKLCVERSAVSNRILLAGSLEDDDLQELFRLADLFCLPSIDRAEAFGVVLLEAMAHGLPIVASAIPGSGVTWVNQHLVSGLNFRVGDPVSLAEACNQILDSDELARTLGKGARQRFLSNFTEGLSVNRVLRLYENLIDTPGS